MKKPIAVWAILAGLVAGPASANCTQRELAGTWDIYTSGHNGPTFFGIACVIVINPDGTFAANSSACAATTGQSSAALGSLKLTNAAFCNYQGTIELVAFSDVNQIRQTTLSRDGNTMSGIGYDDPSGFGYNFTMVRVK